MLTIFNPFPTCGLKIGWTANNPPEASRFAGSGCTDTVTLCPVWQANLRFELDYLTVDDATQGMLSHQIY